jgi:tetratricopeptide (TPR) repeat protein
MNECLTWASLADKAALGEALSAEERLQLRSHPLGCAECAAEADLWQSLEQVLDEPALLMSRPGTTTHAPRSIRSAAGRLASGLRRHALVAAVALLGAAVAGAAISTSPNQPALAPAAVTSRLTPALPAVPAREARRYEITAALSADSRPAASVGRSAAFSGAPLTATALLEQARALRSGGRYQEAGGVYRRLLREFAGSSEARVGLVSLGELQLSQLGDAGGALRSFEAYLAGGGALSQEASYGRIRALRRLGRWSEARTATQAFISAYPHSVQAATLRKELP